MYIHYYMYFSFTVFMLSFEKLFVDWPHFDVSLKALHNIFRTNETNPEFVLGKLKEVVEEKCIPYKQSE